MVAVSLTGWLRSLMESEQKTAETQKQVYLQHVTQLYTDINDWLQPEPLFSSSQTLFWKE